MKRALVIVGMFAASLALAADAKTDQEKLDGTWKAVSAVFDGKEAPKDDVDTMSLTIKGDNYTLHHGEQVAKGTNKLDPSKTPKTIDATRTEGPGKGQSALGIYELTGDTLKVCLAPPGADRPTEFVSKPGSKTRLIVMKREKP